MPVLSPRPRILVADPLAEDGLTRLREVADVEVRTRQPEGALVEAIGGFDALVVRSETKVTGRVLDAATALRVVGRAGVGVDNIDVATATRRGILVVNAPRGNIIAAAEHAVALLLALARNIPQADASVRRGEWQRSKYTGVEVRGKTLGVVGLGNIGSEVAKRAQGLEMEVIAYDPAVAHERAEQFNVELVGLEDLFRRAHFVSIHAPLVEGTRNLIGARVLGLARPGARLVNAARGGIVDEGALYRALVDGPLAGAAADVFLNEPVGEHPLLTLPNFIATPHIAASTVEAQASVAFDVAEEVLAVLRGELPRHAINAPSLPPEEMAFLRPYAVLAERLASLYVQIEGGRVSELEIEYHDDLAEHDVSVVTAAAIRGVCQPFTEERINAVNARLVARNRGLRLVERRVAMSGDDAPDRLTLRLDGSQLGGTVLAGEPRLTRVGQYRMDLVPEGRFLISRHEDRPGMIGKIGTILGESDVNIASMQLGRDAPRGLAMMILTVDDPVGDVLLDRLGTMTGMSSLRYVELGGDG
ncbi:MAG TPA: phosphoglycerate dehydrogenase [Candidatus Dormibacteraeota bacterium]|jgi:D-3-phosphoglycerate dehydrogenase